MKVSHNNTVIIHEISLALDLNDDQEQILKSMLSDFMILPRESKDDKCKSLLPNGKICGRKIEYKNRCMNHIVFTKCSTKECMNQCVPHGHECIQHLNKCKTCDEIIALNWTYCAEHSKRCEGTRISGKKCNIIIDDDVEMCSICTHRVKKEKSRCKYQNCSGEKTCKRIVGEDSLCYKHCNYINCDADGCLNERSNNDRMCTSHFIDRYIPVDHPNVCRYRDHLGKSTCGEPAVKNSRCSEHINYKQCVLCYNECYASLHYCKNCARRYGYLNKKCEYCHKECYPKLKCCEGCAKECDEEKCTTLVNCDADYCSYHKMILKYPIV